MNVIMVIIAVWISGLIGFLVGVWYSDKMRTSKREEKAFSVDRVISSLQLKLITENDNRGFQTRSHVSSWLKRMGSEVKEEFHPEVHHGRKTL